MITGKEKWPWIISAVALVLLFLASSTDLLIKEEKIKIYPVSVIVNDASDDHYVNFRKGMDQAAMELHADVRFITLYDTGNWLQQKDLILREEKDGAEALVIEPVDENAASVVLNSQRIHIPIVYLNGEISAEGEEDAGSLSFDFYGLGRQMGEAVLRNHSAAASICLLGVQQTDMVSSRFRDGILSVLEPAGCEIIWRQWKPEEENSLRYELEKAADGGHGPMVVIALDPRSLLKAADVMADSRYSVSGIAGLYGRGTAVPILNHLDRGRITGLCVTDDFTAGYLSVKMAVDRINNIISNENPVLKSAYIERDDLRQAEYEKMLYPIE